jgi:hypothetical protein
MPNKDTTASAAAGTMNNRRVALFGVVLLVELVLVVVMLVTDKNLQTDFGTQSPYYYHWYGVLAMGVVDLLLALGLLGTSSMRASKSMSPAAQRRLVMSALAWTVIAIVAMVGIVATYSQVGFSTPGQFAQYLFGVTPYAGAQSYLPWLYDLMLALYVVATAVGALAMRQVPSAATSSSGP